jgi:hypothetical protein
MIRLHQDRAALGMVATDGLYTTEKIQAPLPRDTGTLGFSGPDGKEKPALGAWEESSYERGMFAARPGIYFPLAPTEDDFSKKKIRARGVGKKAVFSHWKEIIRAYETGGIGGRVILGSIDRFHGAKSSVSFAPKEAIFTRSPSYGQWSQREVEMTFDPRPKRDGFAPGSRTRLALRKLPKDCESLPYSRAMRDDASRDILAALLESEEQPDLSTLDLDLHAPL